MSTNIYQRTKIFITKSKKLHKNKYDYSKVEYVNAHTKVIIGCPIHGDFEQKPTKHYNHGHGCPKCGGTKKPSTDEFIKKAKEVHGDKYEYILVNYKTSLDDVQIVCPEHGVFKQKPKYHLNGHGCQECAGRPEITTEKFIVRATNIHKGRYDYSLVEYESYSKNVTIICPDHGKFNQWPMVHLRGCGCPKCGATQPYSKKLFEENEQLRHAPGRLYLLKFTNIIDEGSFLKVGITKHEIKDRFKSGYAGYEYEVLIDREMKLYEAFKIEQNILHIFNESLFKPKKPFQGRTECFTTDYKDQIIKMILES